MSVRSMVSDTVASHKHLALHDVGSRWISAVGGQLMRWKAFFQAMFDWRAIFSLHRRLENLLAFPLETLIFSIGVVAVMILIAQC